MTDRPVASAVRPGLRQSGQPGSPHTPTRGYSSTFSSPGAGFRQEEDAVIFEFGTRFVKAGFEGEASPQCCITFGPETSRRVGDFRDWEPGSAPKLYNIDQIEKWSRSHEFWRMDMRHFDLRLFEDRLERAVREIYNLHLLTNAGSQRLVLIIPSVLPHPLLSSLLSLLFNRWEFPSIALLPSPTMAAIAAGLRTALVVDIGWNETIVTAIGEYREMSCCRSSRAMKSVTMYMARLLYGIDDDQKSDQGAPDVNFDFAEEVVMRLGWCANLPIRPTDDVDSVTVETQGLSLDGSTSGPVELDVPNGTSRTTKQFSSTDFSKPIDLALFAKDSSPEKVDDEYESPIHRLIFKMLAALQPDVRGVCMSRIIFVGGGSQLPGLSQRTLSEVDQIVEKYGWSTVRGKVVDKQREKLKEINGNKRTAIPRKESEAADLNASREVGRDGDNDNDVHRADPTISILHPIDEKSQRDKLREEQAAVRGVLRQVHSLGPWAGASLLSGVKVKGVVEVDRDRFLMSGLAGAHKEIKDVSVVPQRQSFGPGVSGKIGERASWTLAGWG